MDSVWRVERDQGAGAAIGHGVSGQRCSRRWMGFAWGKASGIRLKDQTVPFEGSLECFHLRAAIWLFSK